jgi:hypothetical protein
MYINVMAPLVIGDPADPLSETSRNAWDEFARKLRKARQMGVHAVSTDIWWGLVEPSERQYNWAYYDKLVQTIIDAGLKWVPILSLHQCGGNIGDTSFIPLPGWVWTKLAGKVASGNADDVKYVSEQGHASNEYVSCWATDLVLDDYKALITAFQEHFADKAAHITEVNVSLGPAGELRYPSYNSHDKGTDFPTRGALQCYSKLAVEDWERWALAKYGDRDGVAAAWGNLEKIEPPVDVAAFFTNKVHCESQYGRDLFDWYSESLVKHGRKVLTAAIEILGSEGAAFAGIDVGAKIPGVHWQMGSWQGDTLVMGTRLAELSAGLIRTSQLADWNSDEKGHGYAPIIALFKELQTVRPTTKVVLHFTCLEKADGEDADRNALSLARTLVLWVGAEARRQGVTIKGENALGWNLPKKRAWQLMREALALPGSDGVYEGLTLLRITELLDSFVAKTEFAELMKAINPAPSPTETEAAAA